MKFSFFKIFKRKITNSLQGLLTTQDKLEEIKATYEEKSERYIQSATDLLTNAKRIKSNLTEFEKRVADAKCEYEGLIRADKLDDAKVKYVYYKGILDCKNMTQQQYEQIETECAKAKENLSRIDINKKMIDARLSVLKAKIELVRSMDMTNSAVGDFGFDCNEMIDEVEKEIKNTQYKYEAKKEVSEILHPTNANVGNTSLDIEFDEVVKSFNK